MKKLLIITAIFALVACPLFAATVAKAAPAVETKAVSASDMSKMTTITKEMSQGNYPGVLVPGSLTGLNTYISDLSLLANSVIVEYVVVDTIGNTMGMIAYKTEIGTIAAAVSPAFIEDLENIHMFIPQDVLSLMYATKIGSMPFGAGIRFSVQKLDFENQDLTGYTPPGNVDFRNNYDQYLSLKSGIGLGGLDLGASVTLINNSRKLSRFGGINWLADDTFQTSTMQIDLSGRLPLAGGFTTSATLSWLTAQDEQKHVDGGTDEIDRWNNSMLTFSAVIGKDLKLMDSLIVKIAAGLNIGGNTNGEFRYIDNLDASNSYLGFTGSGEGDRTQYGYWYIPFNVAVEAKLNETWTLNSGVQATIVGFNNTLSKLNTSPMIDNEKIINQYNSTAVNVRPELDYAIGVSAKIGDLRLDTMLNPVIFLNGPFFISGNVTAGLNSSIALHYEWN
jgi:hypothetical protein